MTHQIALTGSGTPDETPQHNTVALEWRPQGLAMAIAFMLIVLMSEIASFMPVPLYAPMGAELGLSPATVSWTILASAVSGAVTFPLIARLGDLYGHRRLLVIALILVVVGWFICAAALNAPMLLAGRFLVGLGSATSALTLAIIARHLVLDHQRRAIAITVAGQAAAASLGFILSGAFLSAGFSWRIAFATGGVMMLICLVAVTILVPKLDHTAQTRKRGDLDIPAIILLGLGLAGVAVGLNQMLTWGPTSPAFLFTFIGGLACIAGWVVRERSTPNPLVDVRIAFSRKLWPSFVQFLIFAASTLFLFSIVQTFMLSPEESGFGFGLTPILGALVMLPITTFGILAARLAPAFLVRAGARYGTLLPALGLVGTYLFLFLFHSEIWQFAIAVGLFGFFVHPLVIASTSIIAAVAPKERAAATTGLYVVFALSGQSLATALYGLSLSMFSDPETHAPTSASFQAALGTVVVLGIIGALVSFAVPKDVKLTDTLH